MVTNVGTGYTVLALEKPWAAATRSLCDARAGPVFCVRSRRASKVGSIDNMRAAVDTTVTSMAPAPGCVCGVRASCLRLLMRFGQCGAW
eukprot:2815429-Prymnesium_polylepis.1